MSVILNQMMDIKCIMFNAVNANMRQIWKKNDIKRVKQCTHIGKITPAQLESWYEKNKIKCLFCGEYIPLGNNNFNEYKERKFCSMNCSASYNNQGVNRYKNKPKKIKEDNKEEKKTKQSNFKIKKTKRQCKLCGGDISNQNKSGYCAVCLKK